MEKLIKKKCGRPARTIAMQNFSCELPIELAERVREHSRANGVTINHFVKEAIEEKLEKIKSETKKTKK